MATDCRVLACISRRRYPFDSGAGIAQLVERNVANVEVAGSNPVSRSNQSWRADFGVPGSPAARGLAWRVRRRPLTRRRSQVVRQRSAKPRFGGSIPPAASSFVARSTEAGSRRHRCRGGRGVISTALLLGLTLCPWVATTLEASQEDSSVADQPSLEWTPWISDLPVVDMTGEWVFDEESSDPMVEAWREREVALSHRPADRPGRVRVPTGERAAERADVSLGRRG